MSSPVIAHSPDLAKLRDEKYEIQVHPSNHLIVRNIPYVGADRTVKYGILIVRIVQIADNTVGQPENHQAYFVGEFPCSNAGEPLSVLGQNVVCNHPISGDLVAQYYFSYKSPKIQASGKYTDYYDLVTSYVDLMWKYVKRIDANATPLTGRIDDFDDEPGVHAYRDVASTKAGVTAVSDKLKGHVVAVIGIGGTGSYILDLLAKTEVKEIRLYDGDWFLQHNAFRAPGAAAKGDVFANPPLNKAQYFRSKYSALHLNIVAHPDFLTELPPDFEEVDFVFLCVDKATAKRRIVQDLLALNKPFIDVGMSVTLYDRTLGGALRTTMSTEECRKPRHGISFTDVEDEYASNIQIADLNALNAALAVIRWKKSLGFYESSEAERSSVYTVNYNRIDNGGCVRTERYVYRTVASMPESLQTGVLYHSPESEIASHLCACGCGREVVNGLRTGRWTLRVVDGRPSLAPSIGNGSFPCRSHYYITDGRVQWAGTYTDEMIGLARRRDNPRAHVTQSIWRRIQEWFSRLFGFRKG